MSKKTLITIVLLPLLVISIGIIAWDLNWFKGQVTPHLSDIESHSITLGNIEHSLMAPGVMKINKIKLKGPVANGDIGTLMIEANVWDAISKNIIINEIRLLSPNLKIDMQALSDWLDMQSKQPQNESERQTEPLPVKRIYIKKISIENANVEDVSALQQFLVHNLTLNLTELSIAEDSQLIVLQDNAPITASLDVTELRAKGANLGKVTTQLTATENTIKLSQFSLKTEKSNLALSGTIRDPKNHADIKLKVAESRLNLADFAPLAPELPIPLTGLLQLGGDINTQGELSNPDSLMKSLNSALDIKLDTGKSVLDLVSNITSQEESTAIKLDIKDSKINFDEFHGLMTNSPVKPSGNLALAGLIDAQGVLDDPQSMLKTLTGTMAMSLDDGKLQGININKIVQGFKDSKESDWKDIGSFLVTGPIGILAANLFDLGAGAASSGGETLIPHLQINSKMNNGAIVLSDTALATDKHRLAFTGQINPAQKTFKDFTFALLDKAGCAELEQTLNGSMSNPKSAIAQSLLDSAIAPISGLLKSLKNATTQCTPFYDGAVVHPVSK